MAGRGRPLKTGLDWFPFYVDLLKDRKLRKPRAHFGYLASLVYIQLIAMIYEDKGYYLEYTDDTKEDVELDIVDVTTGKYQVMPETVGEVIADLVASGLFSGDCYSDGYLTSRRIQEQYYNSVSERKTVNINWNIWLLSQEDMEGLSSSNPILDNYIKSGINCIKSPIKSLNRPIKTHSRVENSIEEKSIYDKASAVKTAPAASMAVITIPLNTGEDYPIMQADIDAWSKLYPIVDVMQELRNMKGWCDANPAKRKTKRGVKRFINSWLSRRQDRGGSYSYGGGFNKQRSTPPDADTIAREKMLDDSYDEDMQAIWDAVEGKK